MSYLIKIVFSVAVIIAAAETAKRFPAMGALINALPLMSMIVMCIMYYDTRDNGKVVEYARALPPLVIPSIAFFYLFAFLVERQLGFAMAMLLATAAMLLGYGAYFFFVLRNGS